MHRTVEPLRRPLARTAIFTAVMMLSACASTQTTGSGAANAASGGAAATPTAARAASAPPGASAPAGARAPDPAALKPFADIIKDAKREDGLFPIWRKDEKT